LTNFLFVTIPRDDTLSAAAYMRDRGGIQLTHLCVKVLPAVAPAGECVEPRFDTAADDSMQLSYCVSLRMWSCFVSGIIGSSVGARLISVRVVTCGGLYVRWSVRW
jgi:hypothetical protein